MKLIIKKEALENAVKKIGGVLGQMPKKDAAVVVLQTVVGKRGEEVFKGLTITMSNGQSQVATNIFCELSSECENASVMIGGELVSAVTALSGVKGEFYTLTEVDGAVIVGIGESSIKLSKKVEGVMPVTFDIKKQDCVIAGKVAIDGKAFKSAVSRILFAALLDDDRAAGGIGVVCKEGKIVFRSTDTFRLAESSVETPVENEFTFVVSPSVLKLVLGTVTTEKVVLIKTDRHLLVQVGNDMWQVSLLDKNYPHAIFEHARSMEKGCSVTVNKAELLTALEIVDVSSKDGKFTFELEGDKLVAFGEGKTSKATFGYEVEGELPVCASFSNKFFKQCLLAFQGDKVSFTLGTVSIFAVEGENLFVGLTGVAK